MFCLSTCPRAAPLLPGCARGVMGEGMDGARANARGIEMSALMHRAHSRSSGSNGYSRAASSTNNSPSRLRDPSRAAHPLCVAVLPGLEPGRWPLPLWTSICFYRQSIRAPARFSVDHEHDQRFSDWGVTTKSKGNWRRVCTYSGWRSQSRPGRCGVES